MIEGCSGRCNNTYCCNLGYHIFILLNSFFPYFLSSATCECLCSCVRLDYIVLDLSNKFYESHTYAYSRYNRKIKFRMVSAQHFVNEAPDSPYK